MSKTLIPYVASININMIVMKIASVSFLIEKTISFRSTATMVFELIFDHVIYLLTYELSKLFIHILCMFWHLLNTDLQS